MNKDLERLLQLHTNLTTFEVLSDKDGREYESLIELISSQLEQCETHDCSEWYND